MFMIFLFAFGLTKSIYAFPQKPPLKFYDSVTIFEDTNSLYFKCKTNKKAKFYDLKLIYFCNHLFYAEDLLNMCSISKSNDCYFCFETPKSKLVNLNNLMLMRWEVSMLNPKVFCLGLYNTKMHRMEEYYADREFDLSFVTSEGKE